MGDDITKDVKELQSSFQHMVTPHTGQPYGRQDSDADKLEPTVEAGKDVAKVAQPPKPELPPLAAGGADKNAQPYKQPEGKAVGQKLKECRSCGVGVCTAATRG